MESEEAVVTSEEIQQEETETVASTDITATTDDNSSQEKEYDLVIFGASGFTGQYVVEEVARTVDEEKGLKWAVAGRSMAKLTSVLKNASSQTGKDLEELPIIIADVNSDESLQEMCSKSKLILNCVGPYRFFGHAVVKACIENKTSHIDICGEPGFLENCPLLYNGKAKENGIYIIGSCGWDSIPSEMGFIYTRNQGEVDSIESYIQLHFGPAGGHGNFATWQSAIHGYANSHELKEIRKQLFSDRLTVKKTDNPKRGTVFKNEDVDSWVVPFLGCDRSVVMRTQRHNRDVKGQEPIAFNVFNRVPNLIALVFMMLIGAVFMILSRFAFGQKLLEKYPKILSGGIFSATGPSRKQIEQASFTNTMIGTVPGKEKKLITRISGPEIGYAATPICMVQAAYVLLKEADALPEGGGVLTPGVAFADTTLMDRLTKNNIKFEVVQQP